MQKKTIAVLFGGRSVEHDVSVLTGLQFLEALNPAKYQGLPVYVDPLGQMWTGDALLKRSNYPVSGQSAGLTEVKLDLSAAPATGRPAFTVSKKGLMGTKQENLYFDLLVPAIHGSNGEDGSLQGLLEFAGIPFAGCRSLGAAATMDKAFLKSCARHNSIDVLPEIKISRPAKGSFLQEEEITAKLAAGIPDWSFPLIVKPCNLGSSVGVGKADDMDGLIAALMTAFRVDSSVIIEPFVPNLCEYNVAVRRDQDGNIHTSAIERPLMDAELLDFKNKYLAGGSPGAPKLDTGPSEGMASLNRELNPEGLSAEQESFIRDSASRIFEALSLAGSVRIDFLSNRKSGEIWLNEVNTIPGSFAYFLWEAASEPLSFLALSDTIIAEGFTLSAQRLGLTDAGTGGATIFANG
ncbi:D-alanine--D-alanine ligase [Kordiimonas sediminis]|uniref:D-alanine--D-alanine ligase n=1 Tax=Kordiimonas sediminis TaxID=1735581 RepID=A0A919ALP4_9PROT|nr:D-alanine--D-alanine ligase [Kordiimonas sediminis]GHF15826.1 D-alanine--D-alanine ligase [Kordiimonas sediminis]